jgi:quercetin dioxygenase-like cupin family protein
MNNNLPSYVLEHGPLQLPLRIVPLSEQIEALKKEPAWQHGERVGRTLVKEDGLRVVLTLMRADTVCPEHPVNGASIVQCLRGHLKLHSQGRSIDLAEGEFIALEPGIAQSIESDDEAAFITTIGGQTP